MDGVLRLPSGSYMDFKEETEEEHMESGRKNVIAKDINRFKESVKISGGYYFARFEAGDPTTQEDRNDDSSQTNIPIFKQNQTVYSNITQYNAAMLTRNLYNNQSDKYTSDLVNSYAWDTTILYIQKFSGDEDYSRSSVLRYEKLKTGQPKDERCNIFDMDTNVLELSTETYNNYSEPSTSRGGYYCTSITSSVNHTSNRHRISQSGCYDDVGFRRHIVLIKDKKS